MSRFLQATFAISIFTANLGAQSPAPTSPPSAPPAASPSATPITEDLVNSLGPADLQAVITLLKRNFTEPDAIADTGLNRATVEGLLARLPRRGMLLRGKEKPSASAPTAVYTRVNAGS